jgi:hypothetical protein
MSGLIRAFCIVVSLLNGAVGLAMDSEMSMIIGNVWAAVGVLTWLPALRTTNQGDKP